MVRDEAVKLSWDEAVEVGKEAAVTRDRAGEDATIKALSTLSPHDAWSAVEQIDEAMPDDWTTALLLRRALIDRRQSSRYLTHAGHHLRRQVNGRQARLDPNAARGLPRMADREGWTVVAEHSDEGFSAYTGNRGPGLEAARSDAEAHSPCMLLAQHSDRFARGAGDAPGAAEHLAEIGFWCVPPRTAALRAGRLDVDEPSADVRDG